MIKLTVLIIAFAQQCNSIELPIFSGETCPVAEGCGATAVDSCCVSKMGRFLYSLQWVDFTGSADKFTVHGFWPDRCDGSQPPRSGCDTSRHYTNLADHLSFLNSTLVQQLTKNWPSYTGDNYNFWSHEWNKHGTCISTLEPRCYKDYKKYEDAHDFFVNVMNLYYKYDYAISLQKAGIIPGRSYARDRIIEAISHDTGLQVAIICRGRYLSEIRTWYQAVGRNGLKPISTQGRSSCPKKVIFQKKAPGIIKTVSPSPNHEFVLQSLEVYKYLL